MKKISTLFVLLVAFLCIKAQTTVNLLQDGSFENIQSSNVWGVQWVLSSSPNPWYVTYSNNPCAAADGVAYVYLAGDVNQQTGAGASLADLVAQVVLPTNLVSCNFTFKTSVTANYNTLDTLEVYLFDTLGNFLSQTPIFKSAANTMFPSVNQNLSTCAVWNSWSATIPAQFWGRKLQIAFRIDHRLTTPGTIWRFDDVKVLAQVCSYSISQNNFVCPNSTSATYSNISNVSTQGSSCTWAANVTSGSSWLSTASAASGNGNISINVQANPNTQPRTGTIEVAGQTIIVTQPGLSCTYTLSQTSYTCASSNANTYNTIVNVTAPTGCSWVANVASGSSWLSTSSSGNGNGSISITVQANTSATSRTGTIDVNGQTFTVIQPGISCTYTLSQTSYSCPNSSTNTYSGIVNVAAASGCSWTASVTAGSSWLSTTSSGNGNGSINVTVQSNTTATSRTGTIDVNGQTLTVTQPGTGGGCTYSLSQNTYTCPDASANTYNSIVLANTQNGCSWQATVTSGTSWLATSSSGTGSGTVSIVVLQNTQTSSRTGTIDVNGQTLTVTQPGAACTYSLSQSSYTCSDAYANTYNSVALVSTQNGCTWSATVTSGNNWLACSSAGNGSGTVSIIVLANNTGAARTGNIDINGQILTVTQPEGATDVEDISNNSLIEIYPNPASSQLYISFNDFNNNKTHIVKIIEPVGRVVFDRALNLSVNEVDITSWVKGAYMVHVLNENQKTISVKQIILK
jgi:hypothetical protein